MSRKKREDTRHHTNSQPSVGPLTEPNSTIHRSGSEKRQKPRFIRARVSAEEKELVRASAERAGLTEGAFIRTQCLTATPKTRSIRRPTIEASALARLVGLLGNATGNLNQVSKHLNKGFEPSPGDIEAALAEVRRAAAMIMEVIGRKPKGG